MRRASRLGRREAESFCASYSFECVEFPAFLHPVLRIHDDYPRHNRARDRIHRDRRNADCDAHARPLVSRADRGSLYAGFVGTSPPSHLDFDIDVCELSESGADDELQVKMERGEWLLSRGDFRARWNPDTGHGQIRQSCSPYAIDCVLRIVHGLILARQGGFLVHSASAIRGGKAFPFSGVSGAGKTTISRLAPSDATLLTDEISYVRREGNP
jgi:hypothetical protein